jgi:hypothetical protein
MKARKNPTEKQMARRLSRPLESSHDPRIRKDSYWAMRSQNHSPQQSRKAFRDQPPEFREFVVENASDDPDDVIFSEGTIMNEVIIAIRPSLMAHTIEPLEPRNREYTVWSDSITGFGLRVRESGYKCFVFYYRARYSKKLQKLTLGSTKALSLDDASELAKQFRKEVCRGGDPISRLRNAGKRRSKK